MEAPLFRVLLSVLLPFRQSGTDDYETQQTKQEDPSLHPLTASVMMALYCTHDLPEYTPRPQRQPTKPFLRYGKLSNLRSCPGHPTRARSVVAHSDDECNVWYYPATHLHWEDVDEQTRLSRHLSSLLMDRPETQKTQIASCSPVVRPGGRSHATPLPRPHRTQSIWCDCLRATADPSQPRPQSLRLVSLTA